METQNNEQNFDFQNKSRENNIYPKLDSNCDELHQINFLIKYIITNTDMYDSQNDFKTWLSCLNVIKYISRRFTSPVFTFRSVIIPNIFICGLFWNINSVVRILNISSHTKSVSCIGG